MASASTDPVVSSGSLDQREGRRERLRDFEPAGPPKLRLRLGNRLKVMLIANALPLVGALYLGWGYWRGEIGLAEGVSASRLIMSLLMLVASCVILAGTGWILMPLARWLRDYPLWHFRRKSRLLWAVPTVGGWSAYLFCVIGAIAALMAAGGGIVAGVTRLILQAQEVGGS